MSLKYTEDHEWIKIEGDIATVGITLHAFLTQGGVFSDAMLDAYIELKMGEVTRMRMAPHPLEFEMYYSL